MVSFNELSSMEGLSCLTRLTRLDLSFNAIPRIQGLKVPQGQAHCLFRILCWVLTLLCVMSHACSRGRPALLLDITVIFKYCRPYYCHLIFMIIIIVSTMTHRGGTEDEPI